MLWGGTIGSGIESGCANPVTQGPDMKLTRLRFRVWWLMALVAIVAASLAAETTRYRWVHFRRLAAYHAHAEACYSMVLVPIQRDIEEGERLNKELSVTEL